MGRGYNNGKPLEKRDVAKKNVKFWNNGTWL